MFEFFIALFGGIYYGGKYAKEKSQKRASDDWRKNRDATIGSLRLRYEANYELEKWAEDFVASGKHYDEICEWFADDFQYVFGNDWKTKLKIPQQGFPTMVHLYGKQEYHWRMPSAHVMWVCNLLLAKKGKMSYWVITWGFPVGGIYEKDMSIKFVERIERQLMNAGVQGVRFALELDNICGTLRRTPADVCGGHIKIASTCIFPSHRLW